MKLTIIKQVYRVNPYLVTSISRQSPGCQWTTCMALTEYLNYTQLKLNTEPRRLLITSEPYVVFSSFGYQAAVDVYEKKTKRHWSIYIGAVSFSKSLRTLATANSGSAIGLEFWIRKASEERNSKYLVSE